LILAVNQIALAEAVALGKSLGIDPVLLHSVVNSSSGQSYFRFNQRYTDKRPIVVIKSKFPFTRSTQ